MSLSSVKNMNGFAMQMTWNFCLDKLRSTKHIPLDLGNEIMEAKANPHERLEAIDVVVWIQKHIESTSVRRPSAEDREAGDEGDYRIEENKPRPLEFSLILHIIHETTVRPSAHVFARL